MTRKSPWTAVAKHNDNRQRGVPRGTTTAVMRCTRTMNRVSQEARDSKQDVPPCCNNKTVCHHRHCRILASIISCAPAGGGSKFGRGQSTHWIHSIPRVVVSNHLRMLLTFSKELIVAYRCRIMSGSYRSCCLTFEPGCRRCEDPKSPFLD